jgi:hypothetical protein
LLDALKSLFSELSNRALIFLNYVLYFGGFTQE